MGSRVVPLGLFAGRCKECVSMNFMDDSSIRDQMASRQLPLEALLMTRRQLNEVGVGTCFMCVNVRKLNPVYEMSSETLMGL